MDGAGPWLGTMWLLWALYWLVASFGGKAVRRRESVASRIAHLGPLALAACLLVIHLPAPLGSRFLPDSAMATWLGAGLTAAGLGFATWARVHIAGNWSGTVTLKENHELVRSGPYRWVRHPIYSGLLLAFAGSGLATGEWRGVLAWLIVLLALWRKSRLEERWLAEQFGPEYARYRREVAALVPGIY
jgi:protein-S-isoprenylcysteine O-methyltransferase Ste14